MNLKKWHIAGVIFTLILGTLLHFTYEWSGQNTFVSFFSAINESTWEHLKLLFIPFFLFSIIEYLFYGKDYVNFIPVKLISVLIGMFGIISTFYTYTGILGKNLFLFDISIFIIWAILSYFISYRLLQTDFLATKRASNLAFWIFILVFLLFILFTYYPPRIGLFLDPVNKGYGALQ